MQGEGADHGEWRNLREYHSPCQYRRRRRTGRDLHRLVAGVDVDIYVSVENLRAAYDAVILATGANADVPLPIPGVDIAGS